MKITPDHLARGAFIYIRQSTVDQLANNHESRLRQYGLADRARALGWTDVTVSSMTILVALVLASTVQASSGCWRRSVRAVSVPCCHRGVASGAQWAGLAYVDRILRSGRHGDRR